MPRGQHLIHCDALIQAANLYNVLVPTLAAAAAATLYVGDTIQRRNHPAQQLSEQTAAGSLAAASLSLLDWPHTVWFIMNRTVITSCA
jgi:hypothetical protein